MVLKRCARHSNLRRSIHLFIPKFGIEQKNNVGFWLTVGVNTAERTDECRRGSFSYRPNPIIGDVAVVALLHSFLFSFSFFQQTNDVKKRGQNLRQNVSKIRQTCRNCTSRRRQSRDKQTYREEKKLSNLENGIRNYTRTNARVRMSDEHSAAAQMDPSTSWCHDDEGSDNPGASCVSIVSKELSYFFAASFGESLIRWHRFNRCEWSEKVHWLIWHAMCDVAWLAFWMKSLDSPTHRDVTKGSDGAFLFLSLFLIKWTPLRWMTSAQRSARPDAIDRS